MATRVTVLGAGPGGYAAAFYAADLGMQVTLVDEEKNPGGVCLYRGCIPSKALLHVAKVLDESKHAAAWGIEFGAAKVDLDKLRAYKNQVVDRLTGGTGQVAKLRKITYVQGRATITGPTSLSVKTAAGTQEVTSDYLVLATGLVSRRRFRGCRSTARGCSTRPARSTCRRFPRRCWSSAAATSAWNSGRSTPRSAPRCRSWR